MGLQPERGVLEMNAKSIFSIPRGLVILIAGLASQQMAFGHHAEVMEGHRPESDYRFRLTHLGLQ